MNFKLTIDEVPGTLQWLLTLQRYKNDWLARETLVLKEVKNLLYILINSKSQIPIILLGIWLFTFYWVFN